MVTQAVKYETIIGLEVHAQLSTQSKMFCGCSASYADAEPNTHVCPVCLGMPGVLPVINRKAVEYTVMTALALNCTVNGYTKFDRKNYSYPDLMKGYQISQFDAPVGSGGWLNVEADGVKKQAGITRVHLEEDVAKLLHRENSGESYSLVDVNRSGVPLMEVVGEPDLRSPEEARQYLIALRSILRYLGVSVANMEEGSFRCDANISIRPRGSTELMTKVEVKNMNSFKAVYRALAHEMNRQVKAAETGKRLEQETRGWVEDKGITVSQRSKEYAHDYRYFPEPDLPPLELDKAWIEEIRARLPELPEARRDRFIADYGLPAYDADLLTGIKEMADYFEQAVETPGYAKLPLDRAAKEVSNWLLGPVNGIMNTESIEITGFAGKVNPAELTGLISLVTNGSITGTTAKPVLDEMYATGKDAAGIVAERGLGQISDSDEIDKAVRQAISANEKAVSDYLAGKEPALKFLVGQVMKLTKGRANPAVVSELIRKMLGGE